MHVWSAGYYVLHKAITLNPVLLKAGHEQVRNGGKCTLFYVYSNITIIKITKKKIYSGG